MSDVCKEYGGGLYLLAAEAKSKELRMVASKYVEDIIRQAEESVSAALSNIQNVHKAFMGVEAAKETKPAAAPEAAPAEPAAAPAPASPMVDIPLYDEAYEAGFITIE